MTLEQKLSQSAIEAIHALYGETVDSSLTQLQKTKKEFEGHLTLVVFPFLKISRKNPEQTAQEIGQKLVEIEPAIASFNVIKGFLNLVIDTKVWIAMLQQISENGTFGIKTANDQSPLVMIEYSSPNTNKPLHLGHVRNNLLGFSLAEIMKANGYNVVKTNIVNDRGIHICKSMLAWQKWG
ncbi:MAG: arginine--tRNA ligase, partial [Bacteroidales bacterium]